MIFYGIKSQGLKMNPLDLANSISHFRKTAAMLNKIANIFPVKCC
jgi:hypothetical protein